MACQAHNTASTLAGHLCKVCTTVDFDELFNAPAHECHDTCFAETLPNSKYDYGTLDELQDRSFHCLVCSFLVNGWIRGARSPSEVRPTDRLVLKRWRKVMEAPLSWLNLFGVEMTGPYASCAQFGPLGKEYDGICVAFTPSSVSRYGPMTTFRAFSEEELETHKSNFTLVRSWMDLCEEHHLTNCWKPSNERLEDGELLLIDINTSQIIKARQEMRYITLSYVSTQVGSVPPDTAPFDGLYLPHHLPQTIADALEITKALGERYLWVDAYCISQTDMVEKQRLINKMDIIYEGAVLTICVVNPQDVAAGIYGVSLPVPRFNQVVQTTSIGTFQTVEIPRLIEKINRAAWQSRGWTFQEAVVSRRCLLFTQSGVAMWCKSQVFHETFNYVPPHTDGQGHPAGPRVYGVQIGRSPFSFNLGNQWDFDTWNQIVHVYSSRRLTRDEDSLNAIAGVFNRYSRSSNEPIFCGLPLCAGVCSLLWMISPHGHCQRRKDFASWSWIGWKDTRGMSYDYWIASCRKDLLPSRTELELPKTGLSQWGRSGIGKIHVELRYEAQITTDPKDSEAAFNLPRLTLKTQRAFFHIRYSPELQSQAQAENTNGVWEVLDSNFQKIPSIKGRNIIPQRQDSTLILSKYMIRPSGGPVRIECLCIQQWAEQAGPYAEKKFGDVVTTIAIIRDSNNGEATRVGAIAIPYRFWDAAGPEEVVVTLV